MTLFEKTEETNFTCPKDSGAIFSVTRPINVRVFKCHVCGSEFDPQFILGWAQAEIRTQAIISLIDGALEVCNMNGDGLTVAGKIDALSLEFRHKLKVLIWIMKNDPSITGEDVYFYAERCSEKARKEVDAKRPQMGWSGW